MKAEARLADLRSMTDLQVVEAAFEANQVRNSWPPAPALQVLRDAGFTRGADLEAIYQAGFDAAPVEGVFRTDVDPDRMRADIASLVGGAS